ncbi:MAG: alpha/beta fold hydrolase [Solirubrobacteraceae bacterium]
MSLRTVTQADGHRLAWAEYGDPAGEPLFYMHGTPSCHLEVAAFNVDTAASRLGLRLIVIDRPDMSDSTFQRDRRLLDWPGDVTVVADRLSLDRFGILGYSEGGPYAAATAHAMPSGCECSPSWPASRTSIRSWRTGYTRTGSCSSASAANAPSPHACS